MTTLTIWPEADPERVLLETQDPERVAEELGAVGVGFERWPLADLPPGAPSDEVLAAYAPEVERVTASNGYVLVDVTQLRPSDDPSWPETAAAARQKFLAEHAHADDEDRFFVEGSGIFYLHLGGRVYAVLCTAGDLLSVPRQTKHWFDMGTAPEFTSIRFFHDEEGWVATFTGDEIASSFPDYDTLAARALQAAR